MFILEEETFMLSLLLFFFYLIRTEGDGNIEGISSLTESIYLGVIVLNRLSIRCAILIRYEDSLRFITVFSKEA